MSYRDDLEAAHARIEALEAELARLTEECKELRARNDELEVDARLGRQLREKQPSVGFSKERLREKMLREEAEVEEKMKLYREGLDPGIDD